MMIERCAGCDAPIQDRFLMTVLDKKWHSCCVACCVCGASLSDKCFSREGRLFCREDFIRMFGTKCAGCDQVILSHDLVRRARDRIYHVACFVCAVCKRQLATGEQLYVVSDYHLLCGRDYFQLAEEEQALEGGEGGDYADDQSGKGFIDESLPSKMASDVGHVEMWAKMEDSHYDAKHSDLFTSRAVKTEEIADEEYEEALSVSGDESPASSPGTSTDPQRHLNDACSNNNNNISSNHNNNRVQLGDPAKDLERGLVGEVMLGSVEGQVEGQTNNVGKRRGPRTTIKAKQLETLKNAFANTPKPTRHIREQLAQETGLNMRVIQVWFQNRRSKERRMKQFNAQGLRRNFFRNPRRIQRVPLIGETNHPGHPHLLMRDFFMKGSEGEFVNRSHPLPSGVQGCYPTRADSSELYDPHRMYGGAELLYPDFYSSIGLNHVAQSANQMQGMVHPLTNQRAATQTSSSTNSNYSLSDGQ